MSRTKVKVDGTPVTASLKLDKVELIKKLGLATNEVQDRLIASNARFKIFRAARRVGKSFSAAKCALPEVLMPNTRGWIVGPTYDLAEKEFRYLLDFLMRMNKKFGLPKPTKVRSNPKSGELYIETPWGAEVHGKSADRPLSLVGEENDWIILSEAAQHNADPWSRYPPPTLSTRRGRAIFPTTPDISGIWLYELELDAEKWIEEGDTDWEIFTQPAWECSHFDPREIASAKKELSEDAFMEQFGGEWRFHTGRVFKPFVPKIHVVEAFDIPRNWKTWSGLDYGVRDATACEFVSQSPFGDYYYHDEYYEHEKATEVHVEKVKRIQSKYRIVSRVADHHALGKQLMLDWARYGIPTVPSNADRKTRRDRMLAYLEVKEDRHPFHIREAGLPSGAYPRLFFMKGKVPNLIREILILRWKDTTQKEGGQGDTVGDDHAVDAAEYVLYHCTQSTQRHGPRNFTGSRVVNTRTGY